jgi:hypothetical protein
MRPEANTGPPLGETLARPIAPASDLGETMARPPQALGETLARDVTTVSGGGVSLQQTVRERLADFDTSVDDPIRIGRFTVLHHARRGRHGRRLRRLRPRARPQGRDQAGPRDRDRGHPGPHQHAARGPGDGQAVAPQRRPDLRGRRARRAGVRGHGVRQGPDPDRLAQRGAADLAEIRDMFVQAGHGLAAAHAEGLVHRDFKPDNVLVGADERARVADFGLAGVEARRRDVLSDSTAHVAVAAAVASTSCSPSPARSRARPRTWPPSSTSAARPTRAATCSAFCVALWEALAGERPFPGDNARRRSPTSVTSAAGCARGRPSPRRPSGCTRRWSPASRP